MIQPNKYDEAEKVMKARELITPTEIREDEAGLTHVLIVTTTPNLKNRTFSSSFKVVKLTEESKKTVLDHLRVDEGTVVTILHDGREYLNENKTLSKVNTTNNPNSDLELLQAKEDADKFREGQEKAQKEAEEAKRDLETKTAELDEMKKKLEELSAEKTHTPPATKKAKEDAGKDEQK